MFNFSLVLLIVKSELNLEVKWLIHGSYHKSVEVNILSKTGIPFTIEYKTYGRFQGIIENFVLDVYNTRNYRKGDVVIDLGAGIGDFAVLAAKEIGKSGKVLAIEPSLRNFNLLKKNITKNNIKNVIPYNCAVSDKPGIVTIDYEDEKYEIEGLPLEQIIRDVNLDYPSIFKMDIEGAEIQVIRSSLNILKHCRAIPIELHNTKDSIDKILLPLGFHYIPFNQSKMIKNVMAYSIKHPILMKGLYSQYKSLGGKRSPSSLYKGTEITNIGRILTGLYLKN